jgi:putative selenium metabolism protein SsnA
MIMLLVGNGTVVTRDEKNTWIEQGAVCIKDQVIYDVGSSEGLKRNYPEAEFIDAHGGLIMPGFINTHHHMYSAFARGLSIPGNNPTNFLEILEGTWWKLDRKLTLKQVELSAKVTCLDCIRNGVTTVFDHHASFGNIEGSLFRIADAAKELGIRTCLSYEISDRDGEDKMRASVKENIDFLECSSKDTSGMFRSMIGMHASFTLSDETLRYCVQENNGRAGFHIHVAEGSSDAAHCRENYQTSVVERLIRHGILGNRSIAAHCVHIDASDMELLKESGTMVVHNPESNMGNAVGCPKVLTMLEKGILVGLGTDGFTSDMLESMKVANLLHKHDSENPSAAWSEIPAMLFQHNRTIAQKVFGRKLGVLDRGACADVIIIDYHPYTPMNQSNLNSHILFGMNGKDTITTIINGKVRMKDRNIICREEELLKVSIKEAELLWKDLS